jgi:hypothetical protein
MNCILILHSLLFAFARLQSLAPTNPHCARVVGYVPFSLYVIHKEGLCPCSRDINRLMMMMNRDDAVRFTLANTNLFANIEKDYYVYACPKMQCLPKIRAGQTDI